MLRSHVKSLPECYNINNMFMLGLFQWWYTAGWKGVIASNSRRLNTLAEMFSTKILLRTLFSPWRRIITAPGAGLDAHARAFLDNLVSRFIGFTIRSFVLFSAAFVFIILVIAAILELILWPFVPIAGPVLVIWGLV